MTNTTKNTITAPAPANMTAEAMRAAVRDAIEAAREASREAREAAEAKARTARAEAKAAEAEAHEAREAAEADKADKAKREAAREALTKAKRARALLRLSKKLDSLGSSVRIRKSFRVVCASVLRLLGHLRWTPISC